MTVEIGKYGGAGAALAVVKMAVALTAAVGLVAAGLRSVPGAGMPRKVECGDSASNGADSTAAIDGGAGGGGGNLSSCATCAC